jgi:hypothetical protein
MAFEALQILQTKQRAVNAHFFMQGKPQQFGFHKNLRHEHDTVHLYFW